MYMHHYIQTRLHLYSVSRSLTSINALNTKYNISTTKMPEVAIASDAQSKHVMQSRACSLHRIKHFLESAGHIEVNEKLTPEVIKERISDPSTILVNPQYNKGTAFTAKERNLLGLRGLLPPAVETVELQVRRCHKQLSRFTVPISKYIYLSSLRERNETLFYRLCIEHLEEIMPLIYTPTVGQACQEYGEHFRQMEGMYVSTSERGNIRNILNNWNKNVLNDVSIIVVTDGSRILGLGDLGTSGMGIPIGKLSLYVAAGGFHPAATLPVVIDAGTNNERLLNDEFYLGERHQRLSDDDFYALVDEFMTAVKDKWPKALVQFEDFSNNHCFTLLEKYRNRQLCFNDDIQGTGAVIAAGFLNALKVTRIHPRDCRIIFLGAGAAGIGVADQISLALAARYSDVTAEECRKMFYMIDSKGLVTKHRGDKLAFFKIPYARDDIKENYTDLLEIIKVVKPCGLIGLSGQPKTFTEEILKEMAKINKQPIIFPLSNPTVKAECTFQEAFDASEGRVVFASGSPFPNIVTKDGKVRIPSQGNNLYTFPGLGFGAWLSRATKISDETVTEATLALADSTTEKDMQEGRLYPVLANIRESSIAVAARVMQSVYRQGHSQLKEQPKDYEAFVRENRYNPNYFDLSA